MDRAIRVTGVQLPEKAAEARKRADDAKRLAELNVKSRQGASPKPSFKSMEDEMTEITKGCTEFEHG